MLVIGTLVLTMFVGCVGPMNPDIYVSANSGEVRKGRVTGTGSMWPDLKPLDTYYCVYDWDNIQVGDMITGYIHTSKGIRSRIHYARAPMQNKSGQVVAWYTENARQQFDAQPIWINNYRGHIPQVR